MTNIKSVWGEDNEFWYLNRVSIQTFKFYGVVAMALEAVSEALPKLVLQTLIFLVSDPPLEHESLSHIHHQGSRYIFTVSWSGQIHHQSSWGERRRRN